MRKAMLVKKGAVSVVAATLTILAAQAAYADESGTFRTVKSYHRDYITIDHGGPTFTGGMITGTTTIIESSGGPFMEGANSYSECLVFSSSSDGSLSLQAPCVDTDTSGDIQYWRAVREQGDVGAGGGGTGTWELLGGTGKYAGIAGRCSYDTEYLEGDVLVAIADCKWSKM